MRTSSQAAALLAAALLASALLAAALPGPCRAGSSAEEALRLVSEGRCEDAVPRFEEAVKADPANSSLYLGLGLALQAAKRYSDAIRALEKAAKLAPENPEPIYSIALLHEADAVSPEKAGRPAARQSLHKARKAWERFLKLEKDPKRLAAAREHLEKLAELLR